MSVALFSYGTLQQPEVQFATYERLLTGLPDVLQGYRLLPLAITDPRVIEVSGKAVHTIACATGKPDDRVPGTLFEISENELEGTDAYEVDVYARVEVVLESGRTAWVYVGAPIEA
jgi:hypothetical protein